MVLRSVTAEDVCGLEPSGPLLLTWTLALAYLQVEAVDRFAVVDLGDEAVARLVSRRGGTLVEERLASAEASRVGEMLRMLGAAHVLIGCGAEASGTAGEAYVRALGSDIVAKIVTDDRAHIRGAEAALQRSGVSAVRGLGTGHLQIAVERRIRYDLYRPRGPVFSADESALADVAQGRPTFFVIDRSVDVLYGEQLRGYGRRHLDMTGHFVCEAEEADKTLRFVEEICRAMYLSGLRRDGVVVAVGGGVTLDLAGFAASMFRRGIAYVRIPTTLIGLVDVAVGVKQACNAFGAKNLLGSFYPPLAGILDYSFLRTLPSKALSAGFAEILKMAIVRDEALLVDVESYGRMLVDSGYQLPAEAGRRIAERAEVLMAEELAPNLFEQDLARRVDFGHTFSPVIETRSHYRISHGEAVALDMLLSTAIAANRGICEPTLLSRLLRVTAELKLPCWHPEMPDTAGLSEALVAARCHRAGSLNLVVPQRPGAATFLQDVTGEELAAAVATLEHAAKGGAGAKKRRGLALHDATRIKEGSGHASVGL